MTVYLHEILESNRQHYHPNKKHKFKKFDDNFSFCKRCGIAVETIAVKVWKKYYNGRRF